MNIVTIMTRSGLRHRVPAAQKFVHGLAVTHDARCVRPGKWPKRRIEQNAVLAAASNVTRSITVARGAADRGVCAHQNRAHVLGRSAVVTTQTRRGAIHTAATWSHTIRLCDGRGRGESNGDINQSDWDRLSHRRARVWRTYAPVAQRRANFGRQFAAFLPQLFERTTCWL